MSDSIPISSLLSWGAPVTDPATSDWCTRLAPVTPEFSRLWVRHTEEFKAGGVEKIGPALARWRCTWVDYKVELPDPSVQLRDPGPLYPYQVKHLEGMIRNFAKLGVGFDGSDTGTGKTVVATVLFRELNLRPLVICKKSGVDTWKRWFGALGVQPLAVLNYEKAKINTYSAPFVVKHTEGFVWHLPAGGVVVFDEVHKCGNRDTLNSQLLVTAGRQRLPVLALSATAATNPLGLYALGYVLGLHVPGEGGNWTQFLEAHGCKYDTLEREWYFEGGGPEVMARLHKTIFPSRGGRMRKAEIPGYPRVQIVSEPYSLGEDAERVQKVWAENAEAWQELKSKHMHAEGNTKLLHALQISELAKTGFLVDETRELVAEGLSVAIAVRFSETRRVLQKALGCGAIYGDQTVEERTAIIDRFQADQDHVVVVNMQAGSDSISLNDVRGVRPRVGLTCPTFSAVDLVQWLGRLNRATDKSIALYRLIYAVGTPEGAVCAAVQAKIDNLAALNDGDLTEGVRLFTKKTR